MTEENNYNEIENNSPKIYSKRAIMAFSVFFTTIFGGVLLMQNFKDIGDKKQANIVLLFSILYTILSITIIGLINAKGSLPTLLLNIVGGVILSEYFYPKSSNANQNVNYKKIWKPLIISIIITIPFILAVIYTTINK